MSDGESIAALRGLLLDWYRRHRRDLPWRRTDDPYSIWVSEVMLQQTQVATVIPYYERFIERFPDAASLARADEEEVLALWSGLGYYRRARALHAGARAVVERHGGRLPADPLLLLELPGIGRYTAGAISSMAFGLCEPVLDGNVRRVLSRLFAVDAGRIGRAAEQRLLWRVAAELAQGDAPGDLNQALMELGALVCSPRDPSCLLCPASELCCARSGGDPERYPEPQPRRATEKVRVAVAVIERAGRVLLERPADGNPLRGSWDLPAIELDAGADPVAAIGIALKRRHGLEPIVGSRVGSAAHGILHRRLTLEVHLCKLPRGRVAGRPQLRWMKRDAVAETPISGATRKVLRLADARKSPPGARPSAPPSRGAASRRIEPRNL